MSRRANIHYDDEDDEVMRLHDKVKLLKNVSIQIGEETREQNKFLKQLDSSADSVLGSLGINMDKVKKLAGDKHINIIFYLLAFFLFVVLVIYFMF